MKIFKKIFKIKFTFKIPTKKKILIYDLYSEKILSKILKNDYNVIPTRYENLSLLIFAYSLIVNFKDTFKLKNIYFNYLKTFIDFTQP